MADGFSRASRFARGYHVDQVDAFFARAKVVYEQAAAGVPGLTSADIRQVGFDLVRGGYDVDQVDRALDRVEDAFARRERGRQLESIGRQAYLEGLGVRVQQLQARLARPAGERFPLGSGLELTYDVASVDELCDRLARCFGGGEPVTVEDVRQAVFPTVRGSHGYRELPVDTFLDRAVDVLVSVD